MIQKAIERLILTQRLLVITGAGISSESGVPTFRGTDGLWKTYRAEELATPYAFERDTRTVWEWYNWRRSIIAKSFPNPGHYAIRDLEKIFDDFYLITQNVDGLHGRTGIKNMIEIHGNLWRTRCLKEGTISMLLDVPLKEIPPVCSCGGLLRPDVVWFGESIPTEALERSLDLLQWCETLIIAGTSSVVYPVASFPGIVKSHGGFVIEVNIEKTPISEIADISIQGKSGNILPQIADALRKKR